MDMASWLRVLCSVLVITLVVAARANDLCSPGWVYHDNSCYLLHTELANWYESEIVCQAHRSNLIVIDNAEENIFAKGLIMNTFGNNNTALVWLGATDDIVEGHFLWYGTDRPMTFADWSPGEPNSLAHNLNEDCVVYWQRFGWKWADLDCHQQCFAICEKSIEDGGQIIG